MNAAIRIALVALATLALGACAVGAKLGWHGDREQPTDAIRAACEVNVRTVKGQPDYDVAMKACIDAKRREVVVE